MVSVKRFGIKVVRFDVAAYSENEHRKRACGSKERLTRSQAESRVSSLERKHETPYDAYRCQWCEKIDADICYHVGHSIKFFSLNEKRSGFYDS